MQKFIALLLFVATPVFSQTLTVNQTNPISQMHMLPAGEAPGWITQQWFEAEWTETNFWSMPTFFKNLNTNQMLSFTSAYEQSALFLEYGRALSPNLAVEGELPVVRRYGGAWANKMISDYHRTLGFDSFERDGYTDYQGTFDTTTNGNRRRSSDATSGLSNFKLKLKYWAVHWRKDTGLGFNFQIKFPVARADTGLTSGYMDYSMLLHFAFPIGEESFFYSSIGGTYAQNNWMFQDWPRQTLLWMIDILCDLDIDDDYGVILETAYSSPQMVKDELEYQGIANNTNFPKEDRMASSINALTNWRGQQMVGIRKHFLNGKNMWMIYFVEDFGWGDRDYTGDITYSTNQPDIGLGTKVMWYF